MLNLNEGNINVESLLTAKTSKISLKISVSQMSVVHSSDQKVYDVSASYQQVHKCCQSKDTGKIHSNWFWNNLINVKLSKGVTLSRFFTLLTLKNFAVFTIWMVLLATLHFKCFISLRCVFHYMLSTNPNNFLLIFFGPPAVAGRVL